MKIAQEKIDIAEKSISEIISAMSEEKSPSIAMDVSMSIARLKTFVNEIRIESNKDRYREEKHGRK